MSDFLYEKPIELPSDAEKKAIVNRLKRIEGQVRGIQKMVEEDRYCIDILVQISAIQAALKKVGFTISERHMKHCVAHALKTGDGDEAIEELLDVMKHFSK
ncbi:MAG TPA: metal-sensing transcriptional repressor [Pseudogracilibacillus sp.]|nr:metal-sensing transcriptional repressor [Pseudogracilibacillus sp.]